VTLRNRANQDEQFINDTVSGAMRQTSSGRASTHVSFAAKLGLAACAITFGTITADVQARPKGALASLSPEVATKSYAAKPTMAWVRFCRRMPEECAVDISEPATIELTDEARDTIVRVNRDVNYAIKAKTDKAHWGVEDRWDFAEDGYGDCEDYQLIKRRRLVEVGLPRRALRMTVVIDEEGLGHAVMMVRTDRGDLILDNKRDAVLPWHRTGYTYIKREGDTGSAWASLGGAVASPVATAGR
jgi:predicted transglutaminase-like cysteine proteinase